MSQAMELIPSMILSILGMDEKSFVYRGTATDANQCTKMGIWNLPSTAANIPEDTFRNALVCIPYWGTSVKSFTHLLFSQKGSRGDVFIRTNIDGGDDWSPWRQIAVTTL